MKGRRASVVPVEAASRRGRESNAVPEVSREGALPRGGEGRVAVVPETPSKYMRCGTVLQTDTGGQAEKAEALGRTRVKELGKMHT